MKSAVRALEANLGSQLLDDWERGSQLAENDPAAALAIWEACWHSLPDHETAWFEAGFDFPVAAVVCGSLAEAYRALGRTAEALACARRLQSLNANQADTQPLMVLGMVAHDAGEYDEAFAAFSEADRLGGKRAFKERPKHYRDFFESRG